MCSSNNNPIFSSPSPLSSSPSYFLYILAFSIVLTTTTVHTFNIDVQQAFIHRGPPETYFGYSVAQYRDAGQPWVVVGAPLGSSLKYGLTKEGAVYKCLPRSPSSCQIIQFDTAGNRDIQSKNGSRIQTEEKSNQWFGASVHTSRTSSIIVACAPRYVYFSYNQKRRDPVGYCYVSRGAFTAMTPLAPCRLQEKWGYHRLGSCQAGFSATVDPSGRYVMLGAVGSYYWQGKVFSYDLHNLTSLPYETTEGDQQFDDQYLGYSITNGNFSGRPGRADVAIGQPRGASLNGQVVVMTHDMKHINNITGDTMGAYFGYSLASADLNGDGLDDIIIGAPMYTKPESKDKSYEHGRVYIAYQKYPGSFRIGDKLDGYRHRGRFGNAVTSLGDVNLDGFEDFAVGAPYDGNEMNGAVYIFNGGKNGINTTYSQVIYASDFADPGMKTFGWSLSGGMDLDNNGYPDLLVGAYQSDRAVHLRARPIVNLQPKMTINPSKISLKDKQCTIPDGTRVPCFDVELCLKFNGSRLPDHLNFTTYFLLDHNEHRPARAYILSRPGQNSYQINHDLYQNKEKCVKFKVYIDPNLRDKLSPIKLEAEHSIANYRPGASAVPPVLNNAINYKTLHKVNILKNCSMDEFCIPDLSLTAKPNMDPYLIGTGKEIELNVSVVNKREDAFESIFELEIPIDVEYSHTEGTKVHCTPPKPAITGKNILKCDIGNPFLAKEKLNFIVHLKPKIDIVTASPTFLFLLSVNSTNPELNQTTADNHVQISIPVRVEVNLTSTGASNPEQIIHNASEVIVSGQTTADDFGYLVTHAYTVHNHGPSSIKLAKFTIVWPIKTLDGQHNLYLLQEPQIDITRGSDFNPVSVECGKIEPGIIDPLRLPKGKDSTSRKYSNFLGDDPQAYLLSTNNSDLILSRNKRYVVHEAIGESFLTLEDAKSCGFSRCIQIECKVENFGRQSITFTIRSRLSKKTITEKGLSEFQVSSKLVSEITELPYGVKNNYIAPTVTQVSTDVRVIGLDRGLPIPLWLILLAILVGLLLLSLLALALWKLGFFKRERPPPREDYEPLRNSNGYRHQKGDTSL